MKDCIIFTGNRWQKLRSFPNVKRILGDDGRLLQLSIWYEFYIVAIAMEVIGMEGRQWMI